MTLVADQVTVEQAAIDIAVPLLADLDADASISVGVPTTWTRDSAPHVQVASDGLRSVTSQVAFWALVRFTIWHHDTYQAQQLAQALWCALLDHDGTPPVSTVQDATGPSPVSDPSTGAELAWFALNMRLRTLTKPTP